MKHNVIFDMDGVLVDNSPIHAEAFVIFGTRHGIDIGREDLQPYFGKGNDEIIPGVMKRRLTPGEIERYSQEKEEIYREIFAGRIEPMKGLVPLLKDLKARGIRMAVGSSGMRKNVNFVLEKCGIAEYFDAIADGDMISRAKPDPEVFLLAARELRADPSDCLVFEDSLAGREAAHAAGMKVIGLTTTYKREEMGDFDRIIADFTEVDGSIVEAF